MHVVKSITSRIAALASAGVMLWAGAASAQTFESVHGGPKCVETGHSVAVVKQGGYISVGETFSANCSDADIFIVRSTDDGRQHWALGYDIGGDDVATSVKEVHNSPTGQGGFIITGYTDNLNGAKCHPSRDMFAMRIDECGRLIWLWTYGHPKTSEEAWEVVEATGGNKKLKTSAGDFIIAGWTTYSNSGSRDGYLVRINGTTGNMIWDAHYDAGSDDYFYSLDEAVEGLPSTAYDIVAAGGSDSYGNDYQGWIVRVDANSGQFKGNPHNTATYGDGKFEEFRSIRELHIASKSHLVAVGTTTSISGGNDVYMVETKPDPCDYVDDLIFGHFNGSPSGANAVREIPFNGPYYNAGELILAGYTENTSPGRNIDAFLQVVTPTGAGGLTLNGPMSEFGEYDTDWGWSVEPVEDNYPCRSQGFIMVGFTKSPAFIGNDQQQLYLVKADDNLYDYCTDVQSKHKEKHPQWTWKCTDLKAPAIGWECPREIKPWCSPWWCRLCHCRFKTEECDLKQCDYCEATKPECTGKWHDEVTDRCKEYGGGAKQLTQSAAEKGEAISDLSSFPNPVTKGSDLTLNYTLRRDAEMNITVSDMTGRTVYTGTVSGRTGDGVVAIGTEGWASGTYVMNVKVGGKGVITRVVVTE